MDTVMSGAGVEMMAYHEDTATVRTWFDQEELSASTAVIGTLAKVMDADMLDLDPLHTTVDPEALDALVDPLDRRAGDVHGGNDDVHVRFTHEGHEISVYSSGLVSISAGDDPLSGHHRTDARR